MNLEPDVLKRAGVPLLGEAISRMRNREIVISPGYDGEFGKVRLFESGEKERLLGQSRLFPTTEPAAPKKAKAIQDTRTPCSDPDLGKPSDRLKSVTVSDLSLNSAQQRAVTSPRRHILVIAGPGTGKTRTLTHRIAYLIETKGVSGETVLAVTFTTKAANEMRGRLESLLGNSSGMPTIGTFHALCHLILSEVYNHPIRIIDDVDRLELLSEAAVDVGITGYKKNDLMDRIVTVKQRLRSAHDDLQDIADPMEPAAFTRIFTRYQELLDIQGLLDFEDLIGNTIVLFEQDSDCRNRYRKRICHLFIDEYQDLNLSQYRLMRALFGDRASDRSICAIGDPNQSIYGFRGSEIIYFERFQDDFPGAEVIRLQRNYRSTETILAASHQIISHLSTKGPGSRVYSGIHRSPSVGILETPTNTAEAVAVAKVIERMVGGTGFHAIDFNVVDGSTRDEFGFSEFAVLFRTGKQSAVFEEIFSKAGSPFQTARKAAILKQCGHRQLLSCLKLIHGFGTYSDLIRLGQVMDISASEAAIASFRFWGLSKQLTVHQALEAACTLTGVDPISAEWGAAVCRHLNQWRDQTDRMPVDEQIAWLLERFKAPVESSVDQFVSELLALADPDGSGSATGFLSGLAMKTDTDLVSRKAQKVSLMSMHASKGLEFPVVFISGCETGLIPYETVGHQFADPDEERRLFYVATTSARSHLFLTWAKRRRIYGRMTDRKRSPFMKDIDDHLTRAFESVDVTIRKQKQAQLGLFV